MEQRRTTPAVTDTAVRSARSTGRTATRSGSRVSSRAADEGQQVASAAADEAQRVASTAQEKTQQVVSVASNQVSEVGSTVKDQASRVTGEVVEQGRSIAEQARTQIEEQARTQTRRLADSLSKLGEEVHALAEGRPDDATTIKPYVSDAADAVYDAADRIYGLSSDMDERGIGGVLEDLQSFARRRPGAFLVGAAIAGFGIGRAVRANSSADDEDGVSGNGSASVTTPSVGGGRTISTRSGARTVPASPALARASRGR